MTPTAQIRADLGIASGKVVVIATDPSDLNGDDVIDASGLLVVPGAIDVHFHTGDTIGTGVAFADSIAIATRAAAAGGITTVVPYVWGREAEPYAALVDRYIEEFLGESFLDFSLHAGVRPDMELIQGLPAAFDRGVIWFKFHMDYRKTSVHRMTDDDHRLAAIRIIAEMGGIAMFHAENGYMIDELEDYHISRGLTTWEYFLQSRPVETEVHAIQTVLTLADLTNCRVYIPHLSSAAGMDAIRAARARGRTVYAETCPQYLLLTNDRLRDLGGLVKVGPPLRHESDSQALWQALSRSDITVVASDHSAITLEAKHSAGDNIFATPFGIPIVEEVVPLMWSTGVFGGRISAEQAVSSLSEEPAKLFGLYPQKGALMVGSDADFFLMDPAAEWTLHAADGHGAVGWSPFEGMRMKGQIVATYQRGRPIVEKGAVADQAPISYLRGDAGRTSVSSVPGPARRP